MKEDIQCDKSQFFRELRDILEEVNQNTLRAEIEPDNEELLNVIFRGIHAIKGCAGVFGFEDISEFAHRLETLVDTLRDGQAFMSGEIVNTLLEGSDHLCVMANKYQKQ